MTYTVYHGSPKLFNSFVIDPNLAITPKDSLVEGYGIYLTETFRLAKAIGQYTYEVSIEDEDVTDFTDANIIKKVVRDTLNAVDRGLVKYIKLDPLAEGVMLGNLSVINLSNEIWMQLESNERCYEKYADRITFEDDCISEEIKQSYLNHIGNVMKYYDSSYKHNNLICFRNPECLHIISVTKDDE